MIRRLLPATLAAVLLTTMFAPARATDLSAGTAASSMVSLSVPRSAKAGQSVAVTVHLPANAAAVDGRVLVPSGAVEVLGVAPLGQGVGLRPVEIRGGAAFAAYGLAPVNGQTDIRIVVVPLRPGRSQLRVVIDALAGAEGSRLKVTGGEQVTILGVAGSPSVLQAPAVDERVAPTRAAGETRDPVADGRIDQRDLDQVRADWDRLRATRSSCGVRSAGDVNDDGCVDMVDAQKVVAAQGQRIGTGQTSSLSSRISAAATANSTLTVTSASDTPDAKAGDGVCADAAGQCTLRAAITESNWMPGANRIEFALLGAAPVQIQLSASPMSLIQDRSGGLTIDGYTQSGSKVNTSTVGSNAIPGVEIRGNGNGAKEVAFRITSAGNTVRGLLIHNVYRSVLLDYASAYGNKIIGNWMGFTRTGASSTTSNYAVVMNTGSHDNMIGTPDLADRNLIGNHAHAIESYGPGTDGNNIQNNALCVGPTGFTQALCSTAIDHNFGPKDGLIGGTGPNERNVIGPTSLQGIEFSHGWNPAVGNNDPEPTYHIDGHRVLGNWVGFRGDGSYDARFRSGLNFSSADNAQGINVYDGSNDNVIEGNHVASVYDGIQVMSPNAYRNVVRGNVIGVSPRGEPAPLTGWGVKIRHKNRFAVVDGNTISNAALGGVGLVKTNNTGGGQAPAQNVRITRNIVTNTNGQGIDLFGVAGPDPNDANDIDAGANSLTNTPIITSATSGSVGGTALSGATVEVYRSSRPTGQFGLPTQLVGSAVVATNGTWSLPASLAVGDSISALQIPTSNNTSELSVNVAVGEAPAPPQTGDLVAFDDFTRTVDSGWGAAPEGGTWTHAGPVGDFQVSTGAGRMSVGAGRVRSSSLGVGVQDVSITGRLALDRLPSTGNISMYVQARVNGTNAYWGVVHIASDGSVKLRLRKIVNNAETALTPDVLVAGLTAVPNASIAFRFEVIGGRLQLRAWDVSTPEPTTWQSVADDSTAQLQGPGGIGLRAYTSSSTPNGPVTVALDDLEVRLE